MCIAHYDLARIFPFYTATYHSLMLQRTYQKCQPPSGSNEGLLHREKNGLVFCCYYTEESCFDTSLGSFQLKMLSVLMCCVPWGHLQQDILNHAIKGAKLK